MTIKKIAIPEIAVRWGGGPKDTRTIQLYTSFADNRFGESIFRVDSIATWTRWDDPKEIESYLTDLASKFRNLANELDQTALEAGAWLDGAIPGNNVSAHSTTSDPSTPATARIDADAR